MKIQRMVSFAIALVIVGLVAGCGDDSASPDTTTSGPVTLTMVVYDSFPLEDTSLNAALREYEQLSGNTVKLAVAGDAGTMASKAVLTAGNPEGDVMWGIDNTLLSRVIDADVFEPHVSTELDAIGPALTALVPNGEMTPVDFGDVCINYDIAWFTDRGIAPPTTLTDLLDEQYRDLLVVEDPASSSPGLAFMLATIAQFGESGWHDYWTELRANGVEVVDSWTTAYYERFSGSSGAGPRPLVVSYASSPPAEVIFADPPRTDAPTAVMAASCFRQVEFAGVLRGTDHVEQAGQLVDFLAGPTFQAEIALNLFVWPARTDVSPPQEFIDHSVVVDRPLSVPPDDIAAHRDAWVDEWTEIVVR
jgi:thiamine transport system substrate-binding protein